MWRCGTASWSSVKGKGKAAMPGAIDANRNLASVLGWTPADFGCSQFDPELVTTITHYQQQHGLGADGVCGKITYGSVLLERQTILLGRQNASLDEIGVIAVCEAKRAWLQNIVDLPPAGASNYETCRKAIDDMIRSKAGLDWNWQQQYRDNYEWCGAFAAFAWRAAGLKHDLRYHFWSSTYRLDLFGHYRPFDAVTNPAPPPGQPRRQIVELDEHSGPLDARFSFDDPPRPGDILLVGGKHTAYGRHVTVVESYDDATGTFTTLEGNATGSGPSGGVRHGVIRHKRMVGLLSSQSPTTYHARRLIRPALTDLE
jgi:CHAP domain